MTREQVMSTPIFDQLLQEMAQRAEPRATPPATTPTPAPSPKPTPEQAASGDGEQHTPAPRRRHRAD